MGPGPYEEYTKTEVLVLKFLLVTLCNLRNDIKVSDFELQKLKEVRAEDCGYHYYLAELNRALPDNSRLRLVIRLRVALERAQDTIAKVDAYHVVEGQSSQIRTSDLGSIPFTPVS